MIWIVTGTPRLGGIREGAGGGVQGVEDRLLGVRRDEQARLARGSSSACTA